MEPLTIKNLVPKLQEMIIEEPSGGIHYWRNKKSYCTEVAKSMKEISWFVKSVIKNFPNAEIKIVSEIMYVEYDKGWAKFPINDVYYAFLLPEIIDICYSFDKQITLN